MKAILVIDVDDVSRYHASVYKDDGKGNGELIMDYYPFKPIPKMKSVSLDEVFVKGYKCGWNACLVEELEK